MSTRPRLLPWPDSAGKRCYLVTDDGDSRLSRLADEMEAAQLTVGAELLGHAGEMLRAHKVSEGELRFLVKCLREALSDALRVAESRGGRLPVCADSEPHESLDDARESERGAYE
ncbi:hypothetical protein GTZ89_09225 [Streptomyces sp. SID8382]|uniref:hypothetical protein n=1 Tax=Streptomyces malaysiensis TaxID=92644 RepID=UPI000C2C97C5|nr:MULTISPECIES: hypothetical protein [unclassified Streptomyces]MYX55896.1 hypothetical protein [Streptomyces sp. SID8382]